MLRAVSTPTLDHCVGDATAAYPAELGLKRFVRHLLFVKPDVLIVLDDISTEHEADLELSFHPEEKAVRHDAAFVAQGQHAVLRMDSRPRRPAHTQIKSNWPPIMATLERACLL